MGYWTSGVSSSIMENIMKMAVKKETTFTFLWYQRSQSTVVSFVTSSLNLTRIINYHLDLCPSDLTLNGTIGTFTTSMTKSIYSLKVNLENTIMKIRISSDPMIHTFGTLFIELTEPELILLVRLLELHRAVCLSKNSSQVTLYHFSRLGQLSSSFNKSLENKGWNVLAVEITSL